MWWCYRVREVTQKKEQKYNQMNGPKEQKKKYEET